MLQELGAHADVPEAKADLVHAVYEKVVVAGHDFVSARLTPAAYQRALALAMPGYDNLNWPHFRGL